MIVEEKLLEKDRQKLTHIELFESDREVLRTQLKVWSGQRVLLRCGGKWANS